MTNNHQSVIGRVHEFHQRHGGDKDSIFWRQMVWYRDGACRDATMPEGILQEPPADEFARLQNVWNFYNGRLVAATNNFNELQEQLAHSLPDETGLAKLKELKITMAAARSLAQAALVKLEQTETGQARKGAKDWQAQEAKRQQAWRETVKSV